MAESGSPAASASDPKTAADAVPATDAPAASETGKQSTADEAATTAVNGAEHSPPAAPEDQDTEMQDADDNAQPAAEASSTPTAATKKTPSGSSKKRSTAVPEHKTRKLNKKKSKPQILNLDAKPGELFLAYIKGHQPWPSLICDEEMLPQIMLESRPVTAAEPDGSFRKPEYAPGGKRGNERTFPVMFLYTNEFAWVPNTDLTSFTVEEAKHPSDKVKAKSLVQAYQVAAQDHDLTYFKNLLADFEESMNQATIEAEEASAKAMQQARRKRESAAAAKAAAEEVHDNDEMDLAEEGETSKPKSKKRKKDANADTEGEKPSKTPKTNTKLKLTTPKTPNTESANKKKATKTKPMLKKALGKPEGSEEEAVDTPVVEEKPLTPAEALERKEKEIRYYRHKLQKGFLSRDTVPDEGEVKTLSGYLGKLETYPDLEGSIIRATKIHKVLKAMIRLASIPQDAEYNLKKRSIELLSKWNKVLADDPATVAAAVASTESAANGEKTGSVDSGDKKVDAAEPATNGVGKTDAAPAPEVTAPLTAQEASTDAPAEAAATEKAKDEVKQLEKETANEVVVPPHSEGAGVQDEGRTSETPAATTVEATA